MLGREKRKSGREGGRASEREGERERWRERERERRRVIERERSAVHIHSLDIHGGRVVRCSSGGDRGRRRYGPRVGIHDPINLTLFGG